MQSISAGISYEWEPFTLNRAHLTFTQHINSRLEKKFSSHWGSAVYKWEGKIVEGPHTNRVGILIGETKDLRQRIKQYVSGTQERGNKLWRDTFLTKGSIYLYVLRLDKFCIGALTDTSSMPSSDVLASNNMRLVLEQLLVQNEVAKRDRMIWVVNARQ